MKRVLLLALFLTGLAVPDAGARDAVLIHESIGQDLGVVRYEGVGPGTDVTSLYELSFALEYDPDLLEISGLRPTGLLASFPPDVGQIEVLAGRIEVHVAYDAPVPINGTGGDLFEVESNALQDYFQGERVTIRTLGPEPGQPVRWIDDPQNFDDIKVIVENRVIVGDSGITCLAGDALGDGEVDAGDSGAVLRIVTDIIEDPDVDMRCGSDINHDGNIYAGDAVLILRRAAGFDDPLPRVVADPEVELLAHGNGARLRIARADFAHGATLRVRAVGALGLGGIETSSPALAARRIESEEAVIALADLRPVTGADGVLEFLIEADGVGRIVVDELSLFGANGDALFERVEPLALDIEGPPASLRVALSNTPNPFNPSTTFWMEIPREGRVVLDLFDMKGRKLATLLDEVRPAGRSEHRFESQSDALPSGVYFARLHTEVGSTVRRITLLK